MTKFFNKLKKPYYWPILIPFPNFFFGGEIFTRKFGNVMRNFIWTCSFNYRCCVSTSDIHTSNYKRLPWTALNLYKAILSYNIDY